MSFIDTNFGGDIEVARVRYVELCHMLDVHQHAPMTEEEDRLQSEATLLFNLLQDDHDARWDSATIDDLVNDQYKKG